MPFNIFMYVCNVGLALGYIVLGGRISTIAIIIIVTVIIVMWHYFPLHLEAWEYRSYPYFTVMRENFKITADPMLLQYHKYTTQSVNQLFRHDKRLKFRTCPSSHFTLNTHVKRPCGYFLDSHHASVGNRVIIFIVFLCSVIFYQYKS